jgi:hypothetical protein
MASGTPFSVSQTTSRIVLGSSNSHSGVKATSLQTSTEGIDPQIISAFTEAVSDTPIVKSIVDRQIDDRFKNATKLTQAQLERAIHEGQI